MHSIRFPALCVGFGSPAFAMASSHHIFGLCLVVVLDVPFGGGFVLSYRRFALGLTSDVVLHKPEKALRYFRIALRVGSGRCVLRWFRLTLLSVRLRCWFWTFRFVVVSFYPN